MNISSFDTNRAIAILTLGLGLTTPSFSDHGDIKTSGRVDGHAPVGVMGDHLHKKGEFMASLRHMTMSMEGHRLGENKISAPEVFQRGFSAAAESMDMDMQMLGFMYAPSDAVTLMLMANHLDMEMSMVNNPHSPGHGMHGGMGHMGAMDHSTSGWGDVSLTALVRGWERGAHKLHWNLGLSAPTGSVSEMMHGQFQPYGMQLGSGTWDTKIGATYSGNDEKIGWGAQVLGTVRLEDEGSTGFARSDALETSIWTSWTPSRSFSFSGRIKYSAEGSLKGHYNGPHAHSAPPHFQANYGGDLVEAFLGVNYLFADGPLRGNRLAVEYGLPVYQQLNGVGMNREDTLSIAWQLAW